jgi:hypothetical protein
MLPGIVHRLDAGAKNIVTLEAKAAIITGHLTPVRGRLTAY